MRDTNLVYALREHAEWAERNKYEVPITLCDDLEESAELIEVRAKEIEKLRVTAKELAKERDAAVADIEAARGVCRVCRHNGACGNPIEDYCDGERWEWRGLQKEA